MIHRSIGSGRRILSNPAVHPCEAISPATLLASLIALSHSICSYKSKFFASNKKNALESIRQVENLQICLEEIQNELSNLTNSAILSLSELHLTFQKLHHCLEDCTRQDARLWMLVKSERVACQFRVLVRAIATAIDVLPLKSLNVSGEVVDLVELVSRQARKSRYEVDKEDQKVLDDVFLILNLFEDRIVPDRNQLRRVLDYLQIHNWNECNKEVKFLDSEIGLECLKEGKKEFPILSSLLGFMSYCRCVYFAVVDGEASRQSEIRDSEILLGGIKIDDFRCPITLEIMADPVTVSTGHTYDRSSILKWFSAGNPNPICPNTGEKLKNTELVPNLVLKQLINQYCSENGLPIAGSGRKNRDITRTIFAGSSAAESAIKMSANFLAGKLEDGTEDEINKAAYEIRLLSKTSIFNRSCLVEAGTIPNLVKLLKSKDSSIQENSIAALLNLSKHSTSKAIIVQNGGLDLIVRALKKGLKMEARQHAAATLFYLASIEDYRKLIGENPVAIPALIDLVEKGTKRCKKNALVAIFGLLMHHWNHQKVLESGAVPLLIKILENSDSDREEFTTDSLAVLAALAEKPDGTNAILGHGALNLLMEILNSYSISRAGKEYCVSLLLALCINGGENVVEKLIKNPSLMESLYSQLSEGSSRASKKASALIRVLHEFYERRSSAAAAAVNIAALSQERFLQVR